MYHAKSKALRVFLVGVLCVYGGVTANTAHGKKKSHAGPDKLVAGLTNAAQRRYGARFWEEHPAGVVHDQKTPPDCCFDGSAHSRCVFTGTPYTLYAELCDRLPIEKIALAQSDYAAEAAPKDIEIRLDDGTTLQKTLELKRSTKGKIDWQEVPIGKPVRRIAITVKSNYPGKAAWGGLAEIAVLTGESLTKRFELLDHDPASPVFVHSVSLADEPRNLKVSLPPRAADGEHPRLLMTKAELAELRRTLPTTEKGKQALKALLDIAEGACHAKLDFPDPKGPLGQLHDRSDVVAKRHSALSYAAGDLGFAYALSGRQAYAHRAAEILRGYAERYAAYPEHRGANGADTGKVMAQRLSEAMWLMPLILAYDYIHDSGELTVADRQAIDEKLLRACVLFIRRKVPANEAAERQKKQPDWRTAVPEVHREKPSGNWLNFYNAATLLAGSMLNDRDMIDLAAADYRNLIQNGIGSDGMWGEGAIGYQFFALRAMATGMEAAARCGIDLWSFADSRVKLMFDSPLWYAYPDGTAPGINDSGRARSGDWQSMIYDYGWLRYHDDRYARLVNNSPRQLQFSESIFTPTWVYQDLPTPRTVVYPSLVLGNLGYAILRGGDRYALLKYGPHGGVHGHCDKLNLILFDGNELGGEPRFHRYEDPLHGQWTVQTVAHNTMTVDQSRQSPTAGRLLVFEDLPTAKVMRAEVTDAYPGVLMDRTVVCLGPTVLDLYHGRSRLSHTWDRTLRFNGSLAGMPEVAGSAQPLGVSDGYEHLKRAAERPAERGWQGTWHIPGPPARELTALAAGPPGDGKQTALSAVGPDNDQVVLLRQQGSQANFFVAYTNEPVASGDAVRLLDTQGAKVIAATMTRADAKISLFVSIGKEPWQAAGVQSDARVLVVEARGGKVQVTLCGGTYAKGPDFDVRRATPGNYAIDGMSD